MNDSALLVVSKISRRSYSRSHQADSSPATRACNTRSWFRPATAIGSNWIDPSFQNLEHPVEDPQETAQA